MKFSLRKIGSCACKFFSFYRPFHFQSRYFYLIVQMRSRYPAHLNHVDQRNIPRVSKQILHQLTAAWISSRTNEFAVSSGSLYRGWLHSTFRVNERSRGRLRYTRKIFITQIKIYHNDTCI